MQLKFYCSCFSLRQLPPPLPLSHALGTGCWESIKGQTLSEDLLSSKTPPTRQPLRDLCLSSAREEFNSARRFYKTLDVRGHARSYSSTCTQRCPRCPPVHSCMSPRLSPHRFLHKDQQFREGRETRTEYGSAHSYLKLLGIRHVQNFSDLGKKPAPHDTLTGLERRSPPSTAFLQQDC